MKRLVTLLILLTIVLSYSFGQGRMFQRNFFGFSLLNSKQKVMNTLKQKGYRFKQMNAGNLQLLLMQPVDFGGVHWNEVELSFYQNQLFAVRFNKPKDNQTFTELKRVAIDLVNKYGRDMFEINTWWNDPSRITSVSGMDKNGTCVILDWVWGLTLKYYDQRVAYSSANPGAGDL